MRNHAFLLFFISSSIFAAVNEDQSTAIPSVLVTPPKRTIRSNGLKSVISREQMAAAGVTTLAQTLQNLGGVQLHDTTSNGSQVLLSMRGFGANATSNTLLLINGIPITHPDLAPPNLNAIPLNEIERIEIIAGSESVLYGDQAVGGIINIITREHAKEKIDLSCTGGSYQQRHCYATWRYRHDAFSSHMTIANQHTGNYRNHNDYDQHQLLGSLAYLYQSGRIQFNYAIAEEDMQYPGSLTAQQVRQNRRQSTNDTDFFKNTHTFFHLQHQLELHANWTLQTDLAISEMHGHGVLFSPFTQARSSYFLKPTLTGKVGRALITNGLEAQQDQYQLNSLLGFTRNTLQKYGLFTFIEIPFASRYTLSLGARGAQQRNHLNSSSGLDINRAFASTLGLGYQLLPDVNVYLRRAESFRFPKADELTSTPLGVNGLRTQRGVAYETGIELARENYSGKLGLYQLNLQDEIAFDPTQTPQNPFGSNRNLDPTIRRGISLSGKKQMTDQLALDAQYNFVNARFQHGVNTHHRIPLVSEHILRAGINYHFAEHWYLYPEFIYTGNQYSDNDDANVAGLLGGYTIYNVNLRYEYKQLTAAFRINNIFNKYYYLYTVYQPSMQTEFFYPAPARNVTLIVNYAFL